MTRFLFTGIRADGTELPLPAPAEARFDAADDAPADGFRGVFPLSKPCGTLARLRISGADGTTLFLGTADVQREAVSGTGGTLSLSCRSLAGLLLDSAAVPQTYDSPSLGLIFKRHVEPYGFASFLGDASPFRGTLGVACGMSEWQAAAAFCKSFLGVTPRVRGNVFDASGAAEGGFLPLDNARGTRWFHAEVRLRRCDLLSAVYTPDGSTGVWRPAAEDATAAAEGIRRNRCLKNSNADAGAALRKAERSAFAVLADCPGAPEVSVGAGASFCDPALGFFSGLTVARVRCVFGAEGLRTSYCLRRG